MEPLASALRSGGQALVQLANPALASAEAYAARACAGYPLIELDHAMVAVAGYAALVAYGLATRPSSARGGAEAEKAADKKAPRAAAADGGAKPKAKGFSLGAALGELQREPLKILMLLYNAAQVLLCGYMMAEALRVAWTNYPRVVCNAHDNSAASKLKDVLWLFYVSKVLDFADTFFIVVRGKWEQFSFLHVYHHFSSEEGEGDGDGEARRLASNAPWLRSNERAHCTRLQTCGLPLPLPLPLLLRARATWPASPCWLSATPLICVLGAPRLHYTHARLRAPTWLTEQSPLRAARSLLRPQSS